MQQGKLFMGIDGGGTRSTVVICDQRGNIAAKGVGESINYYSVGMERARDNFRRILASLPNRYTTRLDQVYIGMSALDRQATEDEIRAFTQNIVQAESIQMVSDSHVALMALTRGGPGIIVISGTGSIALAKTADNRYLTVGGWGHLLGDQGSAYDIALGGIRAAIQSYERFIEETELVRRLKRHFAVDGMHELVERFYNPVMERHLIAGFAREVSACAESNDKVARGIIDEAVRSLARHAEVLIERTRFPDAVVGAAGGLFQNSDYAFLAFKKLLERQYPRLAVTIPAFPPEIGALFYCFHAKGIALTDEIIERLGVADSH